MPSLLDVSPPKLTKQAVPTSGGEVDVQGLPADVWAALYASHPALTGVVRGQPDRDNVIGTFEATMAMIAAAAALADGAEFDSKPHYQAVMRLALEDTSALAAKIVQLSYPGEYLVPLRAALANGHSGDPAGRAPATS